MSWQSETDVFEIFPWNHNFETGLENIDEQHRVLVDILNRLILVPDIHRCPISSSYQWIPSR